MILKLDRNWLSVSRMFSVGVVLCAPGIAQTPLAVYTGTVSEDKLGFAVASVGDVNNDGVADYGMGAPGSQGCCGGSTPGYARVHSGLDHTLLYGQYGEFPANKFGYSISGCGDLNQDNFDDFLIGVPEKSGGEVRIVSGKYTINPFSQQYLGTLSGTSGSNDFGATVAGVGDVNSDGHLDFAIGDPSHTTSGCCSSTGKLYVYSGSNYELLHSKVGSLIGSEFGGALAGVGDVNLDGIPDIAVGAPKDSTNGTGAGAVYVLNGATGAVLQSLYGFQANAHFGASLSSGDDLDADGIWDLAVGEPQFVSASPSYQGRVWVISLATSTPIRVHVGTGPGDAFGTSVSMAGDVTGDGVNDLVVGSPNEGIALANEGGISLFSGATGNLLQRLNGPSVGSQFGWSAAILPSIDGDNRDEVILGAPGFDLSTPTAVANVGRAYVHSGNDLVSRPVNSLFVGTATLAPQPNATAAMAIEAPASIAGDTYLLLGSATGTDSIQTPVGNLGLTSDAFFQFTLSSPNKGVLVKSLGLLDVAGKAQPSLKLLAGMGPGLSGLKVWFAAVTLEISLALNLTHVTNTVGLQFE